MALPRYIYYAALHSFTKHRFLCNLTSGSNAYIPSNTSIQQVAGTARPLGHGLESPVADDRKNDLPTAPSSPATPRRKANLTTRFLPSTPRCECRVRTLSGEKADFKAVAIKLKIFLELVIFRRSSKRTETSRMDSLHHVTCHQGQNHH